MDWIEVRTDQVRCPVCRRHLHDKWPQKRVLIRVDRRRARTCRPGHLEALASTCRCGARVELWVLPIAPAA